MKLEVAFMEKTFKVFDREKTLRRSVKLFKKTIKHQKVLQAINLEAGQSIEGDEFDPMIFTDSQIKVLDEQVKYVAETFKISEEELQDADPVEIIRVVNEIYAYATGQEADGDDDTGEK